MRSLPRASCSTRPRDNGGAGREGPIDHLLLRTGLAAGGTAASTRRHAFSSTRARPSSVPASKSRPRAWRRQPFAEYLPLASPEAAADGARALAALLDSKPISYLSLGPALPAQPQACAFVPDILAADEKLFASILLDRLAARHIHGGRAEPPRRPSCALAYFARMDLPTCGWPRWLASARIRPSSRRRTTRAGRPPSPSPPSRRIWPSKPSTVHRISTLAGRRLTEAIEHAARSVDRGA